MNEAPEAEIDVGERASRLQGERVRAAKKGKVASGPLSI
jgi:hypothetical protein